jgi:hypothetical protein
LLLSESESKTLWLGTDVTWSPCVGSGRIRRMASKKKSLKKNPAEEKRELKRWSEQGKVFRAAEFRLRDTEFTHQWAIADWMLAGVKAFGKDKAYKAAMKATGMTEQTLDQFAHTARKVSVLTRVKGVSFGHHRLVAKFKEPDREKRQKKELTHAKKNRLSVADFDLYLKGNAHADEREKKTPTNADVNAVKFMKRCDELLSHLGLQALLSGAPPAQDHRDELVAKLKETAKQLSEVVDRLAHQWSLFLPRPTAVGFRMREDRETWLRNAEWRRRQAAEDKSNAATAGGGQ